MGRLREMKSYCNKVCLSRFLLASAPSLVMRMFLSSWYKEGIFHGGVLSPAFRKKGEVRAPFLHLLFLVSLAQNNLYAQLAYLRRHILLLFSLNVDSKGSSPWWVFKDDQL